MKLASEIVVGLVALEHLCFLALEMFLWDKPFGLKAFGHTQELATATKALAANQGLYNGFLAAGLLWGIARGSSALQLFFLGCVVVAGVFGAATVSRKILWLQALPAAVGLALVLVG